MCFWILKNLKFLHAPGVLNWRSLKLQVSKNEIYTLVKKNRAIKMIENADQSVLIFRCKNFSRILSWIFGWNWACTKIPLKCKCWASFLVIIWKQIPTAMVKMRMHVVMVQKIFSKGLKIVLRLGPLKC